MAGEDIGESNQESLGKSNLPLEFEIIPEIPNPSSGKRENFFEAPLGKGDLEEETLRRLDRERETLLRELSERDQLHALRTSHARKLFWLTVVWIVVIWVILLFQGFGQWFFPIPDYFKGWVHIPFKLSDSVIIAFMTSTTATVLGLYGIAAYWLYGKPKAEEKAVVKDDKKVS